MRKALLFCGIALVLLACVATIPAKHIYLKYRQSCEAIVVEGVYIYHLMSPNASIIRLTQDYEAVESVKLPFVHAESMTTDGEYLYVSEWRDSPRILRIALADFSEQDTLVLVYDTTATELLLVDKYLYVSQGSRIAKINTETWEQVGNLNTKRHVDDRDYFLESLDTENGYLYVSSAFGHARLLKIDLSSFTVTNATILTETRCEGLAVKDGYGYVVCSTSPGTIIKVKLETLAEVDELVFSPGWNEPKSGVTVNGNNLYCLCTQGLVTIDLETFTEIETREIKLGGREGLAVVDGIVYTAPYAPLNIMDIIRGELR